MLVHHRVTSSIKLASTHLYTWVERSTVRVKWLAQEHNTMSLVRAPTQMLDLETSILTQRLLHLNNPTGGQFLILLVFTGHTLRKPAGHYLCCFTTVYKHYHAQSKCLISWEDKLSVCYGSNYGS